jgi:hypothetical protein
MPSHAVRSPWASGPATNTGPLHESSGQVVTLRPVGPDDSLSRASRVHQTGRRGGGVAVGAASAAVRGEPSWDFRLNVNARRARPGQEIGRMKWFADEPATGAGGASPPFFSQQLFDWHLKVLFLAAKILPLLIFSTKVCRSITRLLRFALVTAEPNPALTANRARECRPRPEAALINAR